MLCNWIYQMVISCLLCIVFVGCGNPPQQDPQDEPQTLHTPTQEVTVYHYWDDGFRNLKKEMEVQGEIYNSRNSSPQLLVTSLVHEAYKSNMLAMLEDSNQPELFSYWAGARTASLVRAGELCPIDEFWERQNLDEVFRPVAEMACTYERHKYLIPLVQCYIGVFYNKRIFEKHDLNVPENWTDFLRVCKRLRSKGINPISLGTSRRWPAQYWFDYILLRTAGPEYRNRLMVGDAEYTDSEVLRTMSIWRELIELEYFNPQTEALDWNDAAKLMHNDGAAMTVMGTWVMGAFNDWGWEGKRDFDYFPFPVINPDVPQVTLTVVDGLILSHSHAGPAPAERVMAFFTDPTVQRALSQSSGNFSAHTGIRKDVYSPIHQTILSCATGELAFGYDLATLPKVERAGLQLFVDFMKNPSEVDQLLESMEKTVRPYFKERRESK